MANRRCFGLPDAQLVRLLQTNTQNAECDQGVDERISDHTRRGSDPAIQRSGAMRGKTSPWKTEAALTLRPEKLQGVSATC
jgi:hypothetical protein